MTEQGPPEIETLLRAYAQTPITIRQATQDLSDAPALAAPAPGEWSVAQVVAHLKALDGYALVTFAGGTLPRESLMSSKPAPPFADLLDAFALRRAAVVAALHDLSPERWGIAVPFRSTERTPQQLVKRFVRHDATHLRQIIATRDAVEASGTETP